MGLDLSLGGVVRLQCSTIYIYIYIDTYAIIRQIHQFDNHIGVKLRVTKSYVLLISSTFIYIYIYIYIYIHTYIVGGKRQINYKFILTSLFCGYPLIRGSPCKDESIVSLFFPYHNTHTRTHTHTHIYIYIYIYIYAYINVYLFI